MGGTIFWLRKKKSKAEKQNKRKKSSTGDSLANQTNRSDDKRFTSFHNTGNVKGNPSGTSSAPDHLRASDGSCLDVCTCKKGHVSPLNAWNTTPQRTSSPSHTQKDIGSEAPFEKSKNSTVQLKPSLNDRTNSSQQEINSSTPAVKNKLSAVKPKPSLDSNRSPGITKSKIPLLSKKFQVINRYPSPSDIGIFKYNESLISSPNSAPGATGRLVVGSPFSSPTSLTSLNGTKKTASQSRDIMGTPITSIEKTDSSSIEPIERGSVSPFERKFSSWGIFSAARKHKKGKADQSKKYFKKKDQVLVKKLDITDPSIENEMLERVQSDSINKISPLSKPDLKLTYDKEQAKYLCMDAAVAEKEMLDSLQTDQIPPSISPLSRSPMKFIDRTEIMYVNDGTTEDKILDTTQINGHIRISPSTSSLTQSAVKSTHDYNQTKIVNAIDEASPNEMLERVQTNGHDQTLPSIYPLSQDDPRNIVHCESEKILFVSEATNENEMLGSRQTDVSPSIPQLSQCAVTLTHDNNGATIQNEKLKPVQTDGHNQISQSTSQLSQSALQLAHDNDQPKNMHEGYASTQNKMLEPMQLGDLGQISSSTSPLSKSTMKLTLNKDKAKTMHLDDVTTKNKVLKPMEIDSQIQSCPSTSPISRSEEKLIDDIDEAKFLYTVDKASKNKVLEPVQTYGHSQNLPSTSSLSLHGMIVIHENEEEEILHVNDATNYEDKMLKHMQIDCHSQIFTSPSQSSRHGVTLTYDYDGTQILHVNDALIENKILELNQTEDCSQISSSTSLLSRSSVARTHDNNHAKILHVNGMSTENERLDILQTDGHIQISNYDELVEPECSDVENEELFEDIEIKDFEDFEYIDSYDSEDSEYDEDIDEINLENGDVININKVDTSIGMHQINPNKGEQYTTEDEDDPFYKCKFRTDKIVDLQSDNDVPEKLKFRRGKVLENHDGTNTYVEMRSLRKREIIDNANATSPNSIYIDGYDSVDSVYADGEMDGFNTENSDVVNISKVDTLNGKHHRNPRNKQFPSEEDRLVVKREFRRGRIVDLQNKNEVPKILKFRPRRVMEDDDGTKICVGKIRSKEREIVGNTNSANHGSEYIDSYYSEDSGYGYAENEIVEFNSENDDFVNVRRVDIKGKHRRNQRKGKKITSEEYNPAYKCKFRRGRIVDLQTENDIPRWLNFRRGRVIENGDGTKTYVEKIRLKKREIVDNTNTTSPGSEYIDNYYSDDPEYAQRKTLEFDLENGDAANNINEVDMLQGKHHRYPRRQFILEDESPAYKCKFRRGRIVDLRINNDVPRMLRFRRGRVIENDDGTKTYVRRRRYKKRDLFVNMNATSPDSEKVVLRHQELQEKKDERCLFNDVIEETATILSKSRKSKVKTLVGAFETVISSLQLHQES